MKRIGAKGTAEVQRISWDEAIETITTCFRVIRDESGGEAILPYTYGGSNGFVTDELIDRYGVPGFCKIDVEGWEAEVLAGLSQPVRGLSFEFVSGGLDVAVDCVRRLQHLGVYEFNAVAGERRSFLFGRWKDAGSTVEWLAAGAGEVSSGDLYARRLPGNRPRRDRPGEPRSGDERREASP